MALTRANCRPAGRRWGLPSSPAPTIASQSKRLATSTSLLSRFRCRISPTRTSASCMWVEITARSSASRAPSFKSSIQAPLPRDSPAYAFDISPASGKLALERLEAAVEMIDTVEHRLTMGGQGSDHERDRGAKIGSHDLGTVQLIDTA